MGYAGLMGMREMASEDVALEWHMTSNIYPAPPRAMIGVAKAAIDATRNGENDERIALPDGVSHRVYGTEVPAWVIVDEFRLNGFIDEEVQ
jgi:hypothetical protein